MTKEQLSKYLAGRDYRFAKTLATNPHEYHVCRHKEVDATTRARFEDAIATIQALATPIKFGGKAYKVFHADGYRYWQIPSNTPAEKEFLLNRTREWTAFDDITLPAHGGDAELPGMFSIAGTVLDIGSGDGRAVRLWGLPSAGYHGVESSPVMAGRFSEEFPSHDCTVARFEASSFDGPTYDNVIALHGSMNYLMPKFLMKPLNFMKKGGHLFLMFYKPGHVPAYADTDKARPCYYDAETLAAAFGVEPFEWAEYLIIWK